MKDIIAVVEIDRKNKELLAIKNIDKTVVAKVTRVLSTIDLKSKHN